MTTENQIRKTLDELDQLTEVMWKRQEEWREHVYATFEEGEAFIGQYEDMAADELREMGFEIER